MKATKSARKSKPMHIYANGIDTSATGLGSAQTQPKAFCGKLIYWTTNRVSAAYVKDWYQSSACPECWTAYTA